MAYPRDGGQIPSHPVRPRSSASLSSVFVVFRSVTVVARQCASNVILNEFEIEKRNKKVGGWGLGRMPGY